MAQTALVFFGTKYNFQNHDIKNEITIYDPTQFVQGKNVEIAESPRSYIGKYVYLKLVEISGAFHIQHFHEDDRDSQGKPLFEFPNQKFLKFKIDRPGGEAPILQLVKVKSFPDDKERIVLGIGIDDIRLQIAGTGSSYFKIHNQNGLILRFMDPSLEVYYVPE